VAGIKYGFISSQKISEMDSAKWVRDFTSSTGSRYRLSSTSVILFSNQIFIFPDDVTHYIHKLIKKKEEKVTTLLRKHSRNLTKLLPLEFNDQNAVVWPHTAARPYWKYSLTWTLMDHVAKEKLVKGVCKAMINL
jgi:hypothetical protein